MKAVRRIRFSIAGASVALLVALSVSIPAQIFARDIETVSRLLEQEQFTRALVEVNRLLEISPDDPKLLFLKATTLQKSGSSNAAIEILEELTETHPNMPEPFNNLAIYYAERGDYDKAISTLEKAFQGNNSYATAYDNLNSIYQKLASDAYRQALNSESPPKSLELTIVDRLESGSTNEPQIIVAQRNDPSAQENPQTGGKNDLPKQAIEPSESREAIAEDTENRLALVTATGKSSDDFEQSPKKSTQPESTTTNKSTAVVIETEPTESQSETTSSTPETENTDTEAKEQTVTASTDQIEDTLSEDAVESTTTNKSTAVVIETEPTESQSETTSSTPESENADTEAKEHTVTASTDQAEDIPAEDAVESTTTSSEGPPAEVIVGEPLIEEHAVETAIAATPAARSSNTVGQQQTIAENDDADSGAPNQESLETSEKVIESPAEEEQGVQIVSEAAPIDETVDTEEKAIQSVPEREKKNPETQTAEQETLVAESEIVETEPVNETTDSESVAADPDAGNELDSYTIQIQEDAREPVRVVAEVQETSTTQQSPTEQQVEEEVRESQLSDRELRQFVRNRLESWVEAWTARDFEKYVSHYSGNFTPTNNISLEEWQIRSEEQLKWREFIIIEIKDLVISINGDNATASFTMHYKSSELENTRPSTLQLEQVDGNWYITREVI